MDKNEMLQQLPDHDLLNLVLQTIDQFMMLIHTSDKEGIAMKRDDLFLVCDVLKQREIVLAS